jgi:hypothetical protein
MSDRDQTDSVIAIDRNAQQPGTAMTVEEIWGPVLPNDPSPALTFRVNAWRIGSHTGKMVFQSSGP